MDKELYSTYSAFEELERGGFEGIPESVRFRMMQLMLDACVNIKGEWEGGNPFYDIETLMAIAKDAIDHARQFLDEPDKTLAIRQNALICAGFTKIREQLAARFRGEGRE